MVIAIKFLVKNMNMKEEFKLESRVDGLEIAAVAVVPEGEIVAVLHVVHGMCGSKERFLPFMEFMAGHGVACVAHDHRGHGRSVADISDLGYMYGGGHAALIDDMDMVFTWMQTRFHDVDSFILGHSMGALAVMAYLKSASILPDGAILCGFPAYSPFAPFTYAVSGIMCRVGLGRIRPKFLQDLTSAGYNRDFVSEGRQAWTCSDPEERKKFAEDPRHDFYLTFDGTRALMGLMTEAYAQKKFNALRSDMPVLMLYGDDDPCMGGPSGMNKALCSMHEHGFRDIGIKTYPAMRHEILNEIGKEDVWQDILCFVR